MTCELCELFLPGSLDMLSFVFYWFNFFEIQRAVNIFDIISGNTEINHPLCEECTDTLLDIMDQHLRMIEDDCSHYKLYLEK